MENLLLEYSLLVPVLIFSAVLSIGGALLTGAAAYRNELTSRLDGVGYLDGKDKADLANPLSEMISAIGQKFASKEEGESSGLRRELASAGYAGASAVTFYLGIKMLLFMGALAGGGMLAMSLDTTVAMKMMLALGVPGLAFFLPNMVVRMMAERRANEIRRHLPDAIDLLEICVSGGMGIDQAWNSVTEQLRQVSPLLADEMALTNLEIHLGASRADAMRHMSERTGSEDIASLVGVLVQSEKFGTSIGEALRVFTITMREQRSHRAEESAEKMSVKMLFPMIVMIFPVVLIVAIGPAIITIGRVLEI